MTIDVDKLLAASAHAAVKRDPAAAKALVTSTANAVMGDPRLRAALSDESKALLGSLTSAATSVLHATQWGKVLTAAKAGSGALAAELAMTGTAIAVGMLAATGPVGAVAATVYGALLGVANAFQAEVDQVRAARIAEKAEVDYQCYGPGALRVFLDPVGTGKGGVVVPADIFALAEFPRRPSVCGKPGKPVVFRPALGDALIKLLEGGLEDGAHATQTSRLREIELFAAANPNITVGGSTAFGNPVTRRYYAPLWGAIRTTLGDPGLGVPLERRRIFRLLRQAIQAQHRVKGSDGGVNLYHAYLDLLNDEFNAGHLPRDPKLLDKILFFHATTPDGNNPNAKRFEIKQAKWDEYDHPSPLAVIIADLVHKWETTVNPSYAADIAEREQQARLFDALARVASLHELNALHARLTGHPAGPTFVPRDLFEQIPEAQRQQLHLALRPNFRGMPTRAAPASAPAPLPGVLVLGVAGAAAGVLLARRSRAPKGVA